MSLLHAHSCALSDVGRVRSVNEDACLDFPMSAGGLWVVADGMGGHDNGDVASRMIVEALAEVPEPRNLSEIIDGVEHRVMDVHSQLTRMSQATPEPTIMGSTVAALITFRRQAVCLWAGDSRVYRFRAGHMQRMTRDDSEVEELIDRGLVRREDAELHPAANVITRAVGAVDELELSVKFVELREGDRYLLCSDGLYKELSEVEVAERLAVGGDAAAVCQELLGETLARGSRDNVTVVVVDFSAAR